MSVKLPRTSAKPRPIVETELIRQLGLGPKLVAELQPILGKAGTPVSRGTISAAMSRLTQEGLVYVAHYAGRFHLYALRGTAKDVIAGAVARVSR